jgi:hypothetical protein
VGRRISGDCSDHHARFRAIVGSPALAYSAQIDAPNVEALALMVLGLTLDDDRMAMNEAGAFLAASLRGLQSDGFSSESP